MSELRTLRFAERGYYDIEHDRNVIDLLAITNIGTYRAIVPADEGSKLRARREAFKQYVLSDMSLGHLPHEILEIG